MPIDLISFSACCEESVEVCDFEESEDTEDSEDECCNDKACHCHCYHLTNFFTYLDIEAYAQIPSTFSESEYHYEFQYSMDSYCSLFRPPLV